MITVKEKPELVDASPSPHCLEQLRVLKQHFEIVDGEEEILQLLTEDQELFVILIESVKPLGNAFGRKRVLQMTGQSSDDGLMLRVAVQLPAEIATEASGQLHSFDQNWWLQNCRRTNGALVFDCEIQDAV